MRLKDFQNIINKNKIDLVIFYNIDSTYIEHNITYLSGYGGIGVLVIPSIAKPFLIVPKMEYERAKKSKIKVYLLKKKTKIFELTKKIIDKKRLRFHNIGIDKEIVTINAYKNIKKYFRKTKFSDVSSYITDLRKLKTNDEVNIIRKGCEITDTILKECFKNIMKHKLNKESEISAFLESEANKYQGVSFHPIIASGKNASQPHYTPKNILIKTGFCVIDFGIKYKGYCTDITRTIYFGKPSKKEIEIYNLLLKAQTNTIENTKLNETGDEIYKRLIKYLGSYSKYFIHGLGHGIGIKIHELPNLTDGSKDKLLNNMVFTVEPGIYIPNKFGMRIEDDILMTPKGAEILTKTPKKLIIFKKGLN